MSELNVAFNLETEPMYAPKFPRSREIDESTLPEILRKCFAAFEERFDDVGEFPSLKAFNECIGMQVAAGDSIWLTVPMTDSPRCVRFKIRFETTAEMAVRKARKWVGLSD